MSEKKTSDENQEAMDSADDSGSGAKRKKKSWVRFFIKLGLFFAIFMVIVFFVMSLIGSHFKDSWKKGLEEYMFMTFNKPVEIEELKYISIFPHLALDLSGVHVYENDGKAKKVLSIENFQIAMGFWNVMFGMGKISTLNIENFKAEAGVLAAQSFSFETISIRDEGAQAYLIAKGAINAQPVSLRMALDTLGEKPARVYKLSSESEFELSLAQLKLGGRLLRGGSAGFEVADLVIDTENSQLLGTIAYRGVDGGFEIESDVTLPQKSVLKADLSFDQSAVPMKISGDAVFDRLAVADLQDLSFLNEIVDGVNSVLSPGESGDGRLDFSAVDVDVQLDIKELTQNEVSFFDLRAPITIKSGDLRVGPLESDFDASDLSGEFQIKTSPEIPEMHANIVLKNWSYAAIQKAYFGRENVTGHANIVIDLRAEGNGFDAFKRDLSGKVSFIGGEGTFPAAALNLWGGGLINALLPDFDPDTNTKLYCAIADFKVEKGVARSNALLLDAKRVGIAGEGEYDIVNDDLDITLEPSSKDVAIGDIAAAVNISGSIASPSISPSLMSLGKKLGGLMLGAVNPALLVVTFTDLELGDDHPCSAHLNGQK